MNSSKKPSKLSQFLVSKRGKKILNIAYSWGAAVVIIGALFKLLHWPFGDQMLFIGMMTEFFVFFISGFEQPEEDYKWEQVFPELRGGHLSEEELAEQRHYLADRAQAARRRADNLQATPSSGSSYTSEGATTQISLSDLLSQEEVDKLKESIHRLSGSIDQLARLGEITTGMSEQWQSLNMQDLNNQTLQYRKQLESLGSHLNNLNTAYETQLREVNQQIAAIEGINAGLDHLRSMYEGSLGDSNAFRIENAHMARQLQDLNRVYARLLDAMTINMGASMMPRSAYSEPYAHYPNHSYEGYAPREGKPYSSTHEERQPSNTQNQQ